MIEKLDSHTHFWDNQKLNYPWLQDLPDLDKSFLPDQFLDDIKKTGVTSCIFVQSETLASQSIMEVEFVDALAKKYELIKGIIASAPIEKGEQSKEILEELASYKLVKGIRRLLESETADFSLQTDFLKGLDLVSGFNLPFDVCIQDEAQLLSVEKMMSLKDNNIFILDHCGKPNIAQREWGAWAENIKNIGEKDNVYCKLSGLLRQASFNQKIEDYESYIDHVLQSFGADKILFGGDWPVCNLFGGYQKWIELLDRYLNKLTESEQNKIYHLNAKNVYQLN